MAGRSAGRSLGRSTGPPADPNSLRSAKRGSEWTRVPRNAREGMDPPDWPIYVSSPSPQELELWIEMWKKPQASLWIRDEIINQVAMYCRIYISSMQEGGFVTEKLAAERMATSLLLTVPALLAAKIMIVDPEKDPSEEAEESSETGTVTPISSGNSVRSRFVVVTPSPGDVIEDEYESSTSDD